MQVLSWERMEPNLLKLPIKFKMLWHQAWESSSAKVMPFG